MMSRYLPYIAVCFFSLAACVPAPNMGELVGSIPSSSVSVVSSGGSSSTALSISPTTVTLTTNGTITFSASGGTGTYTYSVVVGSGSIVAGTGAYTAPASAGTATVRVTDSDSHIAEASVRINTPAGSGSTLAISPTSITLTTSQTYTFSASGGATPYTYSVLSGAGSINSSTGLYTAPSTVGNATIRVTDAQGATSDCGVSIQQALAISPASADVEVSGTKSFSASGGVGTYTYSIHSGVGSVHSTTGLYTAPASAGSAVVKVTDSNSNTSFANVNVYEALAISPTTQKLAVTNSFTFSASGGVPPYSYNVPFGSGSIISATGVFTAPNTSVTSSVVRVTDSIGNTSNATVTTNAAVSITPSTFTMMVSGTKTFAGVGGSESYTWAMDSGTGSIHPTTGVYTAPAVSGSAVIRVTDSIGNTNTAAITVNSDLAISPTTKTLIINGTHTFSASGGVAPYTYSVVTPSGGSIGSSSGAYVAPASAGTYTIRATDSLGNTNDGTITVLAASTLAISPKSVGVMASGTQTFTASGGVAPYVYTVTSGTGSIDASTGLFTATSAASTTVITVTDNTGYSVTATANVFNLIGLGNLKLWLAADQITGANDGDAISTWSDLSGNSYHATQSNGTYIPIYKTNLMNGKPGVKFDSNDSLTLSGTGLSAFKNTTGITSFIVSASNLNGTTSPIHISTGASATSVRFAVQNLASSLMQATVRRTDAGAISSAAQATNPNPLRFSIATAKADYSAQTLQMWVNGSAGGSLTGVLTSGSVDNTDSLRVSIGGDGAGTGIVGDILEVLIFSSALGDTDRQTVETYLADKYGIYHGSAHWITNSSYSAALQAQIISKRLSKDVADIYHSIGIDVFPNGHLGAGFLKGIADSATIAPSGSLIPDVSGGSATTSTAGTYKSNVSNYPAIQLNVGQSFYFNPSGISTDSSALFIVAKNNVGNYGTLYNVSSIGNGWCETIELSEPSGFIKYVKSGGSTLSTSVATTSYRLVSRTQIGTTGTFRVNGSTIGSGTYSIYNPAGGFWYYSIGNNTANSCPGGAGTGATFGGQILEAIHYYDSLNSTQRDAVEAYLRSKYNLW